MDSKEIFEGKLGWIIAGLILATAIGTIMNMAIINGAHLIP